MTTPFEYVDPPEVQDLNNPPEIPTFVDGVLVHQTDLNALGANLRYLVRYMMGGHTDHKPLTVLRAVTPNSFPNNVATVITWDTADQNTDSAWDASDPTTVYVQTAGIYRIYFQCGTTATFSQVHLYLLVNGVDIINNSVALTECNGNLTNVEITVQLAAGASIQLAYQHASGATRSSATTFGGVRLVVEWIAP
jgi:hypothetical protein